MLYTLNWKSIVNPSILIVCILLITACGDSGERVDTSTTVSDNTQPGGDENDSSSSSDNNGSNGDVGNNGDNSNIGKSTEYIIDHHR